jgi:hypothetical protein
MLMLLQFRLLNHGIEESKEVNLSLRHEIE